MAPVGRRFGGSPRSLSFSYLLPVPRFPAKEQHLRSIVGRIRIGISFYDRFFSLIELLVRNILLDRYASSIGY